MLHPDFAALAEQLRVRYPEGEARSVARIVQEDAFGIKHAQAPPLAPEERLKLAAIGRRLLAGEPVQYVMGVAQFMGRMFAVSPAVLIPRQETEELTAHALSLLPPSSHDPRAPANRLRVLDIGTGSGCIAVTIRLRRPDTEVWAMDLSAGALGVARQNARNLLGDPDGMRWIHGDVGDPAVCAILPDAGFDLIVSNPPYIPRREVDLVAEQTRLYEPHLALFTDDEDPLFFYRVIARLARAKLKPGGLLLFECNEFNAPEALALVQSEGYADAILTRDLSGAWRILQGRSVLG
ncbi:MAG: peptide chain release factor N(5)-glutamine methyltransferase [Saprospiraceae bacterium]